MHTVDRTSSHSQHYISHYMHTADGVSYLNCYFFCGVGGGSAASGAGAAAGASGAAATIHLITVT